MEAALRGMDRLARGTFQTIQTDLRRPPGRPIHSLVGGR